ncbi:MAG: phosphoglucomutase/phosphomannomutase family protein [Thermoanaerobaculia bacterium]
MIKFGTSGWRGVIGEDFTFESVRVATQGIANYLRKNGLGSHGVVIGYDTRFLSEKFALEAARTLAFNDVRAFLCSRDVPTPCVAFETIRRKADGAINFTASHNPPEYNGLKYSTGNGAPAMTDVTKEIEQEIERIRKIGERIDVYEKEERMETIDPKARYLTELKGKIDTEAIRQSGLRIAVDSLYGTARDYLDYILLEMNIEARIIHNYRDPYFGGYSPECNQKNLGELRHIVGTEHFDVGLATDVDADRFGIVDEHGRFISANMVIALLSLYMKRSRKLEGGLARSVATTRLVDVIAEKLDVPLYETPVGFKYIGELILDDQIALGGEESAGLSIRGHLPEKDGILACLLVAEMMAVRKKKISELVSEMFAEFGCFYSRRVDLKLTPQISEKLAAKMERPPAELGGLTVSKVNKLDGLKLLFEDGTWLLIRTSGTEPVARLYAEASSPKDLKKLISLGKSFIRA